MPRLCVDCKLNWVNVGYGELAICCICLATRQFKENKCQQLSKVVAANSTETKS